MFCFKKALILLFILLLLLTCCVSRTTQKSFPKEKDIINYVNKNLDILEKMVTEAPPAGYEEQAQYIADKLTQNTIVKRVYLYENGVMHFYCGGKGLSVGAHYTGFYYSSDDTPFAMEFDFHELEEITPGTYFWESDDECESFYTVRISENWFYYLMKWL